MTVLACGLLMLVGAPPDSPWIRAGIDVQRPLWGLRNGICVGIWPASVEGPGDGGPRGLLRIGYPLGQPPTHRLVNFIAVEPDVGDGHWRGLSELEPSADGQRGKLFTPLPPDGSEWDGLYPGRLDTPPGALEAERLQVRIEIEPFANGAHVWLLLTFDSRRPGEVVIESFAHEDSKPIRQCVITATMGNYARLRRVHLADGTPAAPELWPRFDGPEFSPFRLVGLDRLRRTDDGGVLVEMTCDEEDPPGNWPHDPAIWWGWRHEKLVQYWRLPPEEATPEVVWGANARRFYWASRLEIPGGISFENTELRQDFRNGRSVVFGIRPE